jgi:hypothetical protein
MSEILKAIHCLRKAKDHFDVFCLGAQRPKVKMQFKGYSNRIEWVINDIKLHPQCSDEIRAAIDEEWQSDVFVVDAVNEKLLKLSPSERENVETILDCILKGETINIVYDKNELPNDTNN